MSETTVNTTKDRLILKFAGESGQGVNSLGEIFGKAVKRAGLKVFAYREYPSVIRGGYASYQLDISDHHVSASWSKCDILVCQSRLSVHKYIHSVLPGGLVIHSIPEFNLTDAEQAYADANSIAITFVDTYKLALATGGNKLMANMVMSGYVAKLIGMNFQVIKDIVSEIFADKPQLLELDIKCLEAGFNLLHQPNSEFNLADKFQPIPGWRDSLLLTGNQAISLGALVAGTRVVYGYPMTPASSILTYLAETQSHSGILVKQAEDEITAAQMAIGSMFMGTRALVCTSGGGFDLMTETVSLAGMTETPFVCIVGQRPGPATGLPTWTNAADLNLAIYSGHGEYPKCVIAAGDAHSAYTVIQEAFNVAEAYQIPVIVLTEKQIAESLYNVEDIPEGIMIERHLTTEPRDGIQRYEITESGISPRWLPGTLKHTYNGNSDEHTPDGSVTEDAEMAQQMHEKRMRKLDTLLQQLPEPELIGNPESKTLVIGWGSTLSLIQDLRGGSFGDKPDFAYLHYKYVYPLKTEKLMQLIPNFENVVLIEHNSTAQLGNLITQQTGYKFPVKWLKNNGRPFFVDELINLIRNI